MVFLREFERSKFNSKRLDAENYFLLWRCQLYREYERPITIHLEYFSVEYRSKLALDLIVGKLQFRR